ncbi:MAG: putative acyltransferase [Hyphomicrobiaceae bacterium]|jgi:predicted acyltransferase
MNQNTQQVATGRWIGLDALRGLAIAAMILVNNPGRWGSAYQYGALRHAEWHGCTFTDLVFPTFLFCAGVAIVPAMSRTLAPNTSWRIARRVASLVLLGMFLSAFPLITFADDRDLFAPLFGTRFPGVLQRIGVCYGLAALLFVHSSVRTQRVVLAACLLLYWPLITLVTVPGFGPPDIGTPMGTLQGYVDRAVFGSHIYMKGAYDPEGLLSTIPSLATCLLGVEVGRIMRRETDLSKKVASLLAFGVGLLAIGMLWSTVLPFNKYLWTSSYAVWTAGVATFALAACVWAFEGRKWQRIAYPLQVYGVNALLVFVGSGILGRIVWRLIKFDVDGKSTSPANWFFETVLLPIGDPKFASLLFALLWILAWFSVLRVLHKKNLIWKV